jgi:hypothetical protein
MNLGEAKKKALALMAEYSVDGVPIPDGENADYLKRMPSFANDAQIEISDKIGIEASIIISQIGTSGEGYNKYPLPTDFKDHRFVNFLDERFRDYRIENGKLLLKKHYNGEFELFYYKIPSEITNTTQDDYEFEVDRHVQYVIPYFMGGMAIQDENPSIADRLLNLYFSKIAALKEKNDDYPNEIELIFVI